MGTRPGHAPARRLLAVARGNRHGALGRHHVAAGEQARIAGHHGLVDIDNAVVGGLNAAQLLGIEVEAQ